MFIDVHTRKHIVKHNCDHIYMSTIIALWGEKKPVTYRGDRFLVQNGTRDQPTCLAAAEVTAWQSEKKPVT